MLKLWFFLFFFRRGGRPEPEGFFTPEFWFFLEKFFVIMGVIFCILIIVGILAYIFKPNSIEQRQEDERYGEET
jgi:preprotein translocase subunit SecG